MSIILFTLISFFSIYYYVKNKMAEMMLFLTMILTNLFGFSKALGDPIVSSPDVFVISLLIIIGMELILNISTFSTEEDDLGKIILICFVWTFLVLIGTIVFKIDTPTFAFKSYRAYLVLPAYFIVRKMDMEDVWSYARYILYFSFLQGVFFYLQFIGVTGILSGYGSDLEVGELLQYHRFGNYPMFAPFFFIYYIVAREISLTERIFCLAFFGMMPIIGQMRGATIALALVCAIHFLLQWKTKYLFYVGIAYFLFMFIVFPMFEKRASKSESSTTDEIAMIVSDPTNIYKNYSNGQHGGTFAFRMAAYAERIQYMIENPKYALTGVGCIHEASPNNKFKFNVGTITENETGEIKMDMLRSADIAWVGILMHFGFIGVFLFTLMFYFWTKKGLLNLKNNLDDIFVVCALLSIYEYFISYDSESLGRMTAFTLMFAMAVITIYLRDVNDKEHYGEDNDYNSNI